MSGTIAGGKAAAATNKARHGQDYYHRIGKLTNASWDKNGRKPRGFAYMKANGQLKKIQAAGHKGGKSSSRAGVKNKDA